MNSILLILLCIAASILFFYHVWWSYLGVMSLYRAKREGTLPPETERFAKPGLWWAYLVDFLGNVLAVVVFLDLPREWLITDRLQRYADGQPTWRRGMARVIDGYLLGLFDPKGYHVRWPDDEAGK